MKTLPIRLTFWVPLITLVFFHADPSAAGTFQPPITNYTQFDFGYTSSDGRYHLGMDLSNYAYAPVSAVADGKVHTVVRSSTNHGLGNTVILEHFLSPKLYTLYAHLANISVEEGDTVSAGDEIGLLGNTGSEDYPFHLHLEMKFWPTLGTITNASGPKYYSYVEEIPSFYGSMDPEPFFTKNITPVTPSIAYNYQSNPQKIYSRPGGGGYELATVEANTPLMAFAYYDDWFLVHFPSNHGPACGWMQGAGASAATSCIINDPARGTVGVRLRSGPSTSDPIVSYVWDQQRFVVKSQTTDWIEVYTDSSISGSSAWVSKQLAFIGGTGGAGHGGEPLQVLQFEIKDGTGGGDGNSDGIIDPGEEIDLEVALLNSGSETVTNVSGILSSDDSLVTITDDDRDWNPIGPGQVENTSDFDFTVSSLASPGHKLEFELEITTDQGRWIIPMTFIVGTGSPLQIDELVVKDGTGGGKGNSDGIVNPGEEIDLEIALINSGSQTFTNVTGILSSGDSFVTITDDDRDWDPFGCRPSREYQRFRF